MADLLWVGARLHALYTDGEYYQAEVISISGAKKRANASIRIHYSGYEEEEDRWLPLEKLKSKHLPSAVTSTAKPKAKSKAKAKAKPLMDYSGLEAGMKLSAEGGDGAYYSAEVVTVSTSKTRSKAPVKVHFVGYTNASDEWVGADRLRSKALKPMAAGSSESKKERVLVVGSINVDLYQKMPNGSVALGGKLLDMKALKGMTLPAKSVVENAAIAPQLKEIGLSSEPGEEEALVLKMDGPFDQKTGGKGANAAAAAGQSFACEFIGNMGSASSAENKALLKDLRKYGKVNTRRCALLDGPTGTAYILLYPDGDNAIVLLGGANQTWPNEEALTSGKESDKLRNAIKGSCALMLQREIPEYVNVAVARMAKELGKPVVMDVGGTDAPLDTALIPYISVIAPNESELTFISGVDTKKDGEVQIPLVREAVTALKSKFKALGNADGEVLVTLGGQGSMHFGSAWVNDGAKDSDGLLPHETRMGRFALSTSDGKPKDTTGAGDCYRGSFVAARYGEGKSVKDAMRWAAAAGSLAVEVEGAMPSMPFRNQIKARAAGEVLVD